MHTVGNKTRFILGEPIYLEVTLHSLLDQEIVLDGCSVFIDIQETNNASFELYPHVFPVMGSIFPYKFSPLIQLSSALEIPPSPNSQVNVSLKAVVSINGITHASLPFGISMKFCDPGQILVGALDSSFGRYRCLDCYAGTYANYEQLNEDGIAVCVSCPKGTYSSSKASTCIPCTTGRYSDKPESFECTPCQPGFYQHFENSTLCFSCPTSFYNLNSGQTTCLRCPSGSITLSSGSNRLSDCVCSEGFYGTPWDSSDSICRPCPVLKGAKCPSNSSIPYIHEGYFRQIKSDGTNIVFECIPLEACSKTEDSNATLCSDGYWGHRCGICRSGRSRIRNQCLSCEGKWFFSLIFSFIILLGLAWMVWNLSRSSTLSRSESRILISSIQTIAVFSRLSNDWSGPTQRLLTLLDLSVISCCYPISLVTHSFE
jgi:hypothetical protein